MATALGGEPGIQRMDVLNYGGETRGVGLPAALRRGVQDAQTRATALREIQRNQASREAFRESLTQKEGERKFDLGSVEEFKTRFGAGESDIVANKAKEPTSPEKKAVFKEAARVIENNAIIMRYLDITFSNEPNNNAHFRSIKLNNPSELQRFASYDSLRKYALNLIAVDRGFQDMYPEFADYPPTSATLRVIEDTLADNRIRARISQRMADVYEQSLDLPKVATDEERTDVQERRKTEQQTYDDKVVELSKLLTTIGVNEVYIQNPPAAARLVNIERNPDRLKDIIKKSANPDTAVEKLACAMINCNRPTFFEMRNYVDWPNKQRVIQDRIRAKLPAGRNIQNFINNVVNRGDADVIEYTALMTEANRLDAKYRAPLPPAVPNADQILFNRFNSRVRGLLTPQGGATSIFETLTKDIKTREANLQSLDREAATLPRKTPEVRDSEQKRLMKENDLVTALEGVLSQSLADSMEERYDKMVPLREQQAADEARQAEEQGKLEKAQIIRLMNNTMQTRWIEVRNGRRISHRPEIRADMMRLMYATSKEEGIKRAMIAQMAAAGMTGINAVDIPFLDFDTGLDVRPLVPPNTTPRYILNEEQLKRFNEVYEAKGQKYADKLFADYFMSRDARDNGLLPSDLKFSGAEWVMLEQKFGKEIDDGIQANADARATMQKMREQGLTPDFRRRLMLYLMFVVLGIGTGGIGAAVVGAGALGVGAAAAGGGVLAGMGSAAAEGANIGVRQVAGRVQQRIT